MILRQDHAKTFDTGHLGNREELGRVKKEVNCNLCFKIIELWLYKGFFDNILPSVYYFVGRIYLMLIASEPKLHIDLPPQPLKYGGATVQLFKIDPKFLNLWVSAVPAT